MFAAKSSKNAVETLKELEDMGGKLLYKMGNSFIILLVRESELPVLITCAEQPPMPNSEIKSVITSFVFASISDISKVFETGLMALPPDEGNFEWIFRRK